MKVLGKATTLQIKVKMSPTPSGRDLSFRKVQSIYQAQDWNLLSCFLKAKRKDRRFSKSLFVPLNESKFHPAPWQCFSREANPQTKPPKIPSFSYSSHDFLAPSRPGFKKFGSTQWVRPHPSLFFSLFLRFCPCSWSLFPNPPQLSLLCSTLFHEPRNYERYC